MYAVLSQKFLMLSGLEWWAIVTGNLCWKTVSCKNVVQCISFGPCGGGLHGASCFWPVGMNIHHNDEVVGLISRKLYVYTLPGNCRP